MDARIVNVSYKIALQGYVSHDGCKSSLTELKLALWLVQIGYYDSPQSRDAKTSSIKRQLKPLQKRDIYTPEESCKLATIFLLCVRCMWKYADFKVAWKALG